MSDSPARRVSLMGPLLLITLGLMFLLGQFVPDWGVGRTWPALLIVVGLVILLGVNRPPRPPEGPRV